MATLMLAQNTMAMTRTSAKPSHPDAFDWVKPKAAITTPLNTVPSMNRSPWAKLISSMMP